MSTPNPSANAPAQRQVFYRALSSKDNRFDGVFFTGVKTTGIYCRPVCGVKTPKFDSCEFFHSAAAAEAAGFRPCLRCRPELAPYDVQQNLAHAIWHKIAEGALNELSLDQFAEQVGLSSRQVRRVIQDEFGVSPVELAQTQRLLFAKKLLQETELSMTDVAYAAGFGSVRRFNALFAERYNLAPGALRQRKSSSSNSLQLRLAYRPPFAWDALIQYLAGRAMAGMEAVVHEAGGTYYIRSVSMENYQGWLKVSHLPQKKQLLIDIAPSLLPVLQNLLARVRRQFDLEANPATIAQHLSDDKLLAATVQAMPGLRVPGAFDNMELGLRAILGQQVSVAGATTIAGRLVARFGTACQSPYPQLSHFFPDANTLANASIDEIASLGMPGRRAATIKHFAEFCQHGGLQLKPGSELAEVIHQLKQLPGIGEWTAQYIAMRALRFPNAFPAGDLGLQKAAAKLADDASDRWGESQLAEHSQVWAPWRSYAAMYLWQSLS